jgi:hypothetical protein
MAVKADTRSARYKRASTAWPAEKAADRIVNSLTKRPKGGVPVIAKKPATKRAAASGERPSRPRTSATDLVPVTRKMRPAAKNSSPLASEWFSA